MDGKENNRKHFEMAGKVRLSAVSCDDCDDDEAATSYCETCQTKLCKLCHASHARQYITKAHILTNIGKVKLLKLNITCSICKEQATKCCHDCNFRLCTICASVHHQLRHITGTTQEQFGDALGYKESRTIHDIKDPKDMSCEELTQPTSPSAKDVALNAVQIKPNCVCGLCGVEAVDFCKDCITNLCEICKQAHKKQKNTKHHNLRVNENSKPSILNISCIFCAGIAKKVCPECLIRLCSKCCDAHHKLSDTLMLIGHTTKESSDIRFSEEITPNSVLFTGDDAERIKFDDTNKRTKEEIGALPKLQSIFKSVTNTFAIPVAPYDINLTKENRPGKPTVRKVYVDSVDIVWKGVTHFCQGDQYQVHIQNYQSGVEALQNFTKNSGKVEGLQPNSSYIFKVCLVMANGETSQCSDNSAQVTTHKSFASKLVHQSRLLEESDGVSMYAVPMTELTTGRNEIARTRKFDIGSRGIFQQIEHTIFLVGATGTGKTTLVDTFTNYILGVTKDDPFRFTVKQEEDREKEKDQTISQTDWITCYSFNPQPGMRFENRINIIDTPGFGDTRGLDKDREHISQIRQLFNERGDKGIQTMDAVCFIVKAPDSRLTVTQKYIFDGILSIFGKDIERNIKTLITFYDGSEPLVLAALKKSNLPFSNEYKFNNSVLFSTPNEHTSKYWKINFQSFDALLCHLKTAEPQSLQLTREVLKERYILDLTRKSLLEKVNDGLLTIRELEKQIQIFKTNADEIERNKNFTYSVKELQTIKVNLLVSTRATNCNECNVTCHGDCSPILESFPRFCRVMTLVSGNCTQCDCSYRSHETTDHRLEKTEITVEKTYEDMQRKYKDAKGKMPTLEQVISRINEESKQHEADINEMVNTMTNCANRLKEIALQPACLGFIEQIDQMIYVENNEAREGFQDRVEELKKYRDRVNVPEILRHFKETRDTGSVLQKKKPPMWTRKNLLRYFQR